MYWIRYSNPQSFSAVAVLQYDSFQDGTGRKQVVFMQGSTEINTVVTGRCHDAWILWFHIVTVHEIETCILSNVFHRHPGHRDWRRDHLTFTLHPHRHFFERCIRPARHRWPIPVEATVFAARGSTSHAIRSARANALNTLSIWW